MQDCAEATKWYRTAAEAGHAAALLLLLYPVLAEAGLVAGNSGQRLLGSTVAWDGRGLAEYVSSDEEVDMEAVAPYPGPEWDGTYIVDTKPFVLPYKKTKVTVADHVEHCRKKIVRCMKAGGTLVIDLGDNCPDFANKISIKKYRGAFPIGLFNPAGHKKCSAGIFVRSKGDGPPTVKDGFAVVVVAQQTVAIFKKELKDLTDAIHDHLAPVVVVGTRPTPIVGLADTLA